MKLNLLPATVSKGAKARTAWIGSIAIILVSVLGSAYMIVDSQGKLRQIKQEVADMRPKAQEAYDTSTQADAIIARADNVIRNRQLADAILAHNSKYPELYRDVRAAIPPFFRITSMSATPIDATTAQVNLAGTLDTYQQYADLMLALFRMKGATAVGRSGYVATEQVVPALTEIDQNGRPRRANEQPIPDDPLERLAYFQSQGSTDSFTGTGNFGTATNDTRFATPDASLVNVTIVVSRNIQAPDVRGTLQGAGGPAGGGAPAGGATVPAGGGAGADAAGGRGEDDLG